MVYSTYLWWFGGWFIIVLPTLQMDHWYNVFTLVGYAGYGGVGGGALSSNNGDVSKNHWRLQPQKMGT